MSYKQVPFNEIDNVQPNAVFKLHDDPNRFTYINLDVESDAKLEYEDWLAEGNTPDPAD